MKTLVEKKNHQAVHGLFHDQERAERHLRTAIPDYVRRGFFVDKNLTADSFEIIDWPLKGSTP